ncbi:hypothetical protein [Streptomyces sp. 5-10]|uniref:hypothetical protein n=1 Tax=Streptomyces sp. 5-10 TaxID=878925 RepID=UPI00168BFF9D|nr:hypothetical protein [Streptomyces sp. 5-10]MBD3004572.1 hypothetical protein [Streptomyces sp. 5-10]
MTEIKVTGLTPSNSAALREVLTEMRREVPLELEASGNTVTFFIPDTGSIEVTPTTATFRVGDPLGLLGERMAKLPTRGHPRASLHAVVRKVRAGLERGERGGA